MILQGREGGRERFENAEEERRGGILSVMEGGREREAFEEERIPKPPREGREDEQLC